MLPGPDRGRHRRGLRAAEPRQRRRLVGAARALRDGLGDLHDDAPARLRARRVDPRRRARDARAASTRSPPSTAAGPSWCIASALGVVTALFIGTVQVPAATQAAPGRSAGQRPAVPLEDRRADRLLLVGEVGEQPGASQELRKRSSYGSPKPSTSSVAMISRMPSGTRCAGSNPSSEAIRSKPTL